LTFKPRILKQARAHNLTLQATSRNRAGRETPRRKARAADTEIRKNRQTRRNPISLATRLIG
jgi:hypothetical protein